jgi:group II intron reverse transcriptase/maturase
MIDLDEDRQLDRASTSNILEITQRWMPMDVEKTQTKLATWSQDQDFRFDDIYNFMCYEDWLRRAYKSVKSNSGSRTAGIDSQTMEDFEEDLEGNLKDLRRSLKSQSFDPKPVRRTYIPKGDGEERPLGIPTVKDRIVQEALRMVLEPIYETDFSDYSLGFRPNRSTHDAIKAVRTNLGYATKGKPWVLDLDIKGYFENVDHGTLGKILQNRITDRKVLKLIWSFLKAGVMEDGKYRHSMLGTPQGGIVSPLLANVYLNELDQWVKEWTETDNWEAKQRRNGGKGNWHYVRYADDFLLMTNGRKGRAEKMMERVEDFLTEELNLTLSEEKSELIHAEDGFSFLGYDLEIKTETGGVLREIPREAIRDIKAKVREATDGNTDVSIRAKLKAVDAVLRGWANYYKYATNTGKVFNDVQNFVWHKITHWMAEKLKCSRKELISKKLDSRNPISMNGVSLTKISELSDKRTESFDRHDHPYLGNKNTGREKLPREEPWLANKEESRTGWQDARWKALKRDNWKCQLCGQDLETRSAHVHHKRAYGGQGHAKDANRLENLESLCAKCHRKVESKREFAHR